MCLHSITVPTTSRYISLRFNDRFLNTFACGHCAECVSLIRNQWCYRANYEFDDLPDHGYIMFDCLSYSDKNLPHLSDFWTFIDRNNEDYPCFNRKHIRNFLQLLRTRLIRAGYDKNAFRYFFACEYGTKPGCTHRPHIHLMLWIHDTRIKPLYLSSLIAEIWKFGRTDGIPYKSAIYVTSHNCVYKDNNSSRLRTIQYMTKYLQKSCKFQKVLNIRVAKVMRRMADYVSTPRPDEGYFPVKTSDEWLESELARRERLKLLRMVNQYHSSSQHFGESALADIDFDQICRTGCLYMPHSGKLSIPVVLPMYYKRKMFYDLVEIDGARYWQLNELGLEYQQKRSKYVLEKVADKLHCQSLHAGIDIDPVELSDYLLNKRGRIIANESSFNILDKVENLDYYNYSTVSDKLQFNCRGLSKINYGSSQIGYTSNVLRYRLALNEFISRHVYIDTQHEERLKILESALEKNRKGKQKAFELRQHLEDVYKMFSGNRLVFV